MFFYDILSSREFLALIRYDDRGFFTAVLLGVLVIFVNSSITVKDYYFRSITFQSATSFYLIYISVSGYFWHLQTLERYQTIILARHDDGGIFLKNPYTVGFLCLMAACSAVYYPPKFRRLGIKLPTVSNGDVLSTLVFASLLRNGLVLSFFLFLTLLSLDLAYLEEQASNTSNYWEDFEKSDFTLRFILGYSVLPIFSVFLLFKAADAIFRMTSGSLTSYRPDRLNVVAKKYQIHSSRRSFKEQSDDN